MSNSKPKTGLQQNMYASSNFGRNWLATKQQKMHMTLLSFFQHTNNISSEPKRLSQYSPSCVLWRMVRNDFWHEYLHGAVAEFLSHDLVLQLLLDYETKAVVQIAVLMMQFDSRASTTRLCTPSANMSLPSMDSSHLVRPMCLIMQLLVARQCVLCNCSWPCRPQRTSTNPGVAQRPSGDGVLRRSGH